MKNLLLINFDFSSSTDCFTSQPLSFKILIPLPATFGFGSIELRTTLGILYFFIAFTHGGVFPSCEQGS